MSVPTGGKVALVTGGSRGIGFGAAQALARKGFAIALNALPDDETLDQAVASINESGGTACAVPFDVTDSSAFAAAFSRAESLLGPLTTLVNNAGVGVMERGDPLDVTEASWDRCMTVNAKAVFFLTQAFAAHLISSTRRSDRFYSVVNVTSSNAVAVAVPRAEYCASKAAAAMVSKTWAARLGGEGIHVYDIQPGLIATDMTAPVIDQYEARAKDGLTLLPRVGDPQDMGEIIATLSDGNLPYTTGQVISADGGLLVPRF